MKAVLFDLDGTLARMDIRLVEPIASAVEFELGHRPEEEDVEGPLRELLGYVGAKSKFKVLKIVWNIGESVQLSFFRKIRFIIRAIRNYNRSKYNFELIDGAEANIRWALDNYKVALVTSASRKAVESAKMQIPILREIKVVVTDDDVKNPKPDSEPILLACKGLGVDPSEAIYIGDLTVDVIAGKKTGCHTIAFLGQYGQFTKSLILEQSPDVVVEDHAELAKVLMKV